MHVHGKLLTVRLRDGRLAISHQRHRILGGKVEKSRSIAWMNAWCGPVALVSLSGAQEVPGTPWKQPKVAPDNVMV